MEEFTPSLLPETKPQRPTMLMVLCILTFIWSGMYLFSDLVVAGFYDVSVEIAQEFAKKFNVPGIDQLLLETSPLFFLISALFYAGSLAGAILMMRLKKIGFHVYTIFQILLILAPMYFMHLAIPDFLAIMFTGLFILLYSTNLKFMS